MQDHDLLSGMVGGRHEEGWVPSSCCGICVSYYSPSEDPGVLGSVTGRSLSCDSSESSGRDRLNGGPILREPGR
jgi:hypothetical protein